MEGPPGERCRECGGWGCVERPSYATLAGVEPPTWIRCEACGGSGREVDRLERQRQRELSEEEEVRYGN